jgi:hypothetical protein
LKETRRQLGFNTHFVQQKLSINYGKLFDKFDKTGKVDKTDKVLKFRRTIARRNLQWRWRFGLGKSNIAFTCFRIAAPQ